MLTATTEKLTLFDFLVCPKDNSSLITQGQVLICEKCHRQYPIVDGIPVFIIAEDNASQGERGTKLFEDTPAYFERLHEKRLNEWGVVPYLSETFTESDSWALDVGCGSGTLVLQNAAKGIASVGIDISLHGAKLGQKLAREKGLTNCFFVVGDAVNLPFKSNTFSLVTNYTAIEHVYDHDRCLQEMVRVTRSGGRVLVNTINNFSWRPENGFRKALHLLIDETGDYMKSVLKGRPVTPHADVDPRSVDEARWKSGEEVDLYHARSYDLLYKAKRYIDIENYTSYSNSPHGWSYRLTAGFGIQPVRLPFIKAWLYRLLCGLGVLPLFRHMGRTITIVGRKKKP